MSVRRSVDTFTRVGLSFTEREKGVTYDRGKGERDLGWLSEHGGLVVGSPSLSFDVGRDLFLIWCGSVICSCLE